MKWVREYWSLVVTILLFGTLFTMCGVASRDCSKNEEHNENIRIKWQSCIAHLHNAANAISVDESRQEMAFAILCLNNDKDMCIETPQEFNTKMEVMYSLYKELSIPPVSRADEEALIQKVARVVFDGGQSCYKGNCKLKIYTFICSDYKQLPH